MKSRLLWFLIAQSLAFLWSATECSVSARLKGKAYSSMSMKGTETADVAEGSVLLLTKHIKPFFRKSFFEFASYKTSNGTIVYLESPLYATDASVLLWNWAGNIRLFHQVGWYWFQDAFHLTAPIASIPGNQSALILSCDHSYAQIQTSTHTGWVSFIHICNECSQ